MNNSKTQHVIKSTFFGILNNITVAILNFVSRKLFLEYIGLEYLSVSQVVTNLLVVLSFTELGLSNSVLYMLYKPVAEGDEGTVKRIISLYKRYNYVVGAAISVLGLALMPFLHMFISTSIPMAQIYIFFLLNLIYTVSSYFCTYRAILLSAYQQDYISSVISAAVSLCRLILQCAIIVLTKSYLFYLITTILIGLLQNLIIYYKVGKLYPYIKRLKKQEALPAHRKELLKNVKAMFSVKVTGIVINNTDNILVSMINTIMVGVCANYTSISTQLKSMMLVFNNSLMHSLGIAGVEHSKEQQYSLFKKVLLVNTFLSGAISVPLGVLWDDFIILWIGEQYLLPPQIMWAILINFIWNVISASIWMFRDANGLFVYVKKMLLLNAASNLILSIIFGKIWGIAGVYIATIIADIFTDFWYDSDLVYRQLFDKKNARKYRVYITLCMVAISFIIYLCKLYMSQWEINIFHWILKGAISLGIYVIIFVLFHFKTNAFKQIWQEKVVRRLIKHE